MFRRRSNYTNEYNFDGMPFIDLLESKLETEDEDPAVTIIKGANSMGGTFATNNADVLYLARNLIATYGAEPMRYKGALGWTKVCLQFIETGTKYRLKMEALKQKLLFEASDIIDGGSTLSNFAEDPGSKDNAITSEGLLSFINNQSYDKTKKGKLEAVNDYYDSLKVSQVKNYVRDFENLFGALCYYPSDTLAYGVDVDVDEDEV